MIDVQYHVSDLCLIHMNYTETHAVNLRLILVENIKSTSLQSSVSLYCVLISMLQCAVHSVEEGSRYCDSKSNKS